jgi:uncharacterized protein
LQGMKRILLLSDTHGFLDQKMVKHIEAADEVWHAGDWGTLAVSDYIKKLKPLRGVWGNIDGHDIRAEHPLNNRFVCDGVDVLITHIGGYPGKYSPAIREELKANPPKLFICGHSHILKVMRDPILGLLHINPGAAGIKGFHNVRTMVRFKIDSGKITDVEAIELGKRADLANLDGAILTGIS